MFDNTIGSLRKKLGDRGLIVYEKSAQEAKFYYLLEKEWMAYKLQSPAPYDELVRLRVAVGKRADAVFIDFKALKVRASTESSTVTTATTGDIVIHDHGDFYAIPSAAWQKNEMPDGAEGDAGVMVEGGALVANIPDDNLPIGTFCVLVNLALLSDF